MAAAARRRSPAELVLSLAVLVLGIAVAAIGASLSGNQGYSFIGPDMMPITVGIGLGILGAWLLVEALSGGWRNPEPDLPEARGDHPFLAGAFLWVLGGLAVQMALMHTVGFVIAAGVLFFCVARGFGSTRPVRAYHSEISPATSIISASACCASCCWRAMSGSYASR